MVTLLYIFIIVQENLAQQNAKAATIAAALLRVTYTRRLPSPYVYYNITAEKTVTLLSRIAQLPEYHEEPPPQAVELTPPHRWVDYLIL